MNLLRMILLVCCAQHAMAQTYYVAVGVLNMRDEPDTGSNIIKKLSYCDNLVIQDEKSNTDDWVKVSFNGLKGYVHSKYIKKGKCRAYTTEYRIGAVCNDGTTSSATGRGACSHHGGVKYWRTKSKINYTITDNLP